MAQYLTSLNQKGFAIYQDTDDYAFSQDSVFLANVAKLSKNDKVLDLGTGCGILSFLAIAKKGVKHCVGIELQPNVVAMTKASIALNGVQDNFEVIEGDVKNIRELVSSESFDKVLCNPPYFVNNGNTPPSKKSLSRIESTATLLDFVRATSYALKFGGECYFVMKVERLQELLCYMSANNLSAKTLTLIYPLRDGEVDSVIIRAKKGGKIGLKIISIIAQEKDGSFTKQYKEIFE